jgi:AraC family transcriptional regulator
MPLILQEGKYFGTQIRTMENEFFCCNISSYEPREKIHAHYHENTYLSLLIRGNYVEQHHASSLLLEPGNCILRPALYDHANSFQNKYSACLNIELKQGFEPYAMNLKLPARTKTYATGKISSAYRLLHYFTQQADQELCLEQALHCFLEACDQNSISSSLPWLEKIKKTLEDDLETKHTLQSLAQEVCVHPVHLSATFKKKTGFTISEYQLKLRLEKAMRLLFKSKMQVHAIATQCGFYDAAHFVHSFRLIYKTSPQRFRAALNA